MDNNYEVITTFIEHEDDSYSTYLLGDTLQEAEEIFNEFKPYITKLAKIYAKYSNIDKHDLFGEAILALGKAKKKYNSKLGHFTPYAKFYIIDGMNECIRKYSSIITIPSYIHKIYVVLIKLKNIFNKYTDDETKINELLYNSTYFSFNISNNDIKSIDHYKHLINKKAYDLNLTYDELIEELNYLPNIEKYDENKQSITNYNILIYKMVIDELKTTFTTNERHVANLLMEGLKKYEIMKELNKSDSWVENRIKSIKNKLIKGLM